MSGAGDAEPIRDAARAHGLSEGAVMALWDALRRGGGRQAQFSHPDLGGMGQWSDGMVQIGAMFDHALNARVAAACADLSAALARRGPEADPVRSALAPDRGPSGAWWPGDLGRAAASGAQDGTRYACFPDARRLAVERGGRVTVYDTGPHRIIGVSQSRSRGGRLAFTGEDGTVEVERLRVVAG